MINEEATFEQFGYYSTELSPKSNKKIIAVCDGCGKVRILRKYAYHSLCLSCKQKGEKHPLWKGGLVMRICEFCGTEFPVAPAQIKNGRGKCCSPKCHGKWMSTHLRGENNNNWQGGKIMRVCEICGMEFPIDPSAIKQGRGRFCSPKCQSEWQSKYCRGENSPAWQGGISFEPYCEKFNDEFKEDIRDKFDRLCFLCDKNEEENGKRLSVHHVNYNKACGCDDDKTCQFVPLCIGCNSKVNFNREMWEKKIKAMMRNKLSGWAI